MDKKTTKAGEDSGSPMKKVMAGVGIAAMAAAAAGAIFLYGTDAGKKKRKDIKAWSLRMKADVMDKMEQMKDWSEESYSSIVDNVTEKYKGMKNIDIGELALIAKDLKNHWKAIKRHIDTGGKTTKKSPARKKAPKKAETPTEATQA